jgi:SAM-dependent methyltransferase
MNHYDNPEFFASYAQMSRSQHGLDGAGEWHQLQPLFPDTTDKDVLDLGCGYGWHCRFAADHGARSVLGIDQSKMMIAEAQKRNAHEKINYCICSLQDYDYPKASFDLAVSNLVLHYVEDLDAVYRCVFRTLRAGGVFLLNIEHPTFTAGVNQQFAADGTWPVDRYYEPGGRQTDFLGHTITKYHHTLTQILMGLIHAGFRIAAVEEAMPPEEWRAMMPGEMRRPMMLLVRAEKEPSRA